MRVLVTLLPPDCATATAAAAVNPFCNRFAYASVHMWQNNNNAAEAGRGSQSRGRAHATVTVTVTASRHCDCCKTVTQDNAG